MADFTPTDEQIVILDAFKTGGTMVVEAGAGTGKTSTLKLLAKDAPNRKGVYIAYNKAIADEASADFPAAVQCRTAHSLAFREKGKLYSSRLKSSRVPGKVQAQILGIYRGLGDEATFLSPTKLARIVGETVTRFCYSADSEIWERHVPIVPGTEEWKDELEAEILPLARQAWADAQNPNGSLPFKHDYYLKMWALDNPILDCDYVLLDEAQDANPVIAQIVEAQTHAQRILVGDRCQSIYGWRGAVDAMETFDAEHRLVLSQSFRFGVKIADEANKWLGMLDAPLRLSGFTPIASTVGPMVDLPHGTAVLCRTNAGVLSTAMEAQGSGKSVAIVGGADPIKRYAEAAVELMAGKSTWHPELCAFKSWADVQEYVQEDEDAGALKVIVRMIDSHGPQRIIEVATSCADERDADVIASTSHKAKGREWDHVQIATDFQPQKSENGEEKKPSRPEMMLAYVAVTRAKVQLDNLGLTWIEKFLPQGVRGR
jgi:hypothetical protein